MAARPRCPGLSPCSSAEVLVRGMPAGLPLTLLCSAWLVLGYGAIGEALRRRFSSSNMFDNRRRLLTWAAIVMAGTLFNAVGYMSLLSLTGRIPAGEWATALLRFGVGDTVGMLVSMPLIWVLVSERGRERLRKRRLALGNPGLPGAGRLRAVERVRLDSALRIQAFLFPVPAGDLGRLAPGPVWRRAGRVRLAAVHHHAGEMVACGAYPVLRTATARRHAGAGGLFYRHRGRRSAPGLA